MVATTFGVMLAISIAIQASPNPSTDDWRWLDQFRQVAFDALMPVAKPLVEYRSFRDLYEDVHERYFMIAYADGAGFDKNRLIATVVVPTGQSIQQQLLELHMRDRQASFDSLISKVAVRRYLLSPEKCPAVTTRMDALSKVMISIPDRDVFSIHPVLHRVTIDFGTTRLDATIEDADNPLVRWATETANALLACAARLDR